MGSKKHADFLGEYLNIHQNTLLKIPEKIHDVNLFRKNAFICPCLRVANFPMVSSLQQSTSQKSPLQFKKNFYANYCKH